MRQFIVNDLSIGRTGAKSLESRGEIERLMPGSERGCRKSAIRQLAGSLLYLKSGSEGG
jgi:hypothetical protein